MCGPMKCRKNFSDYLFRVVEKWVKIQYLMKFEYFIFGPMTYIFPCFCLENVISVYLLQKNLVLCRFWDAYSNEFSVFGKKKNTNPSNTFSGDDVLLNRSFVSQIRPLFSFFGSFYFANTRTGRVISLPHPAKERMT